MNVAKISSRLKCISRLLIAISACVALILLSACSEEANVAEHYNPEPTIMVEFVETNPIIQRTTGYTITTQVGRRTYLFEQDDPVANTDFINTVEAIINGLDQFMDIPYFQLRIRHTTNPQNYHFSATEISFNLDNDDTFGWLAHILSRGSMPMWLSVGLEAYVRAGLGLFAPASHNPSFALNNSVFLPYLWGTEEHTQAINAAYHSVVTNGHLEDVINHMPQFWLSFNLINNSITATKDMLTVNFVFEHIGDLISLDDIEQYIAYISDAKMFVTDFFTQHRNFELSPIEITINYTNTNTFPLDMSLPRRIYINDKSYVSATPALLAHAVLLDIDSENLPVGALRHGISNYLRINFNASDNFTHVLPHTDAGDRSKRQEHYRNLRINGSHALAYNHFANGYPNYFSYNSSAGNFNIGTTDTAHSFGLYLIDTYEVEYFLDAIWNVENFVNVYGRDVHGMIDEWMIFLKDLFSTE